MADSLNVEIKKSQYGFSLTFNACEYQFKIDLSHLT